LLWHFFIRIGIYWFISELNFAPETAAEQTHSFLALEHLFRFRPIQSFWLHDAFKPAHSNISFHRPGKQHAPLGEAP
jgi:hypothetical protein